jgi:hypothetical protein
MRITAYSYTGDRVLRIMDPSRNPQFNVRPDITGISAEGLEISCEGGPPDRRVEERRYSVYFERDEIRQIVAAARESGIVP